MMIKYVDRAKAIRLALGVNNEEIAKAVAAGRLTPEEGEAKRLADTDRVVALIDGAIRDYLLREATGGYH